MLARPDNGRLRLGLEPHLPLLCIAHPAAILPERNVLIDAHSHLDMYEDALKAALEEITRHSIFTISNSLGLSSYERNLEIAEACDLVLPTFGVHPQNAPEYADRLKDLSNAIEQSPMLGEVGLDYYIVKDVSQYPAQRKVLECFLSEAEEQEKIVNVHTKGAERDILDLLGRHRIRRAILHRYSGPLDVFYELVALGAYFTIGVDVLYSEHVQTIARKVPSEQLLTETDGPGGQKDTPRMPLLVKDVIQTLADLRKTAADVITQMVQTNFVRLIRDDPWLTDTYDRVFGGQHNGI